MTGDRMTGEQALAQIMVVLAGSAGWVRDHGPLIPESAESIRLLLFTIHAGLVAELAESGAPDADVTALREGFEGLHKVLDSAETGDLAGMGDALAAAHEAIPAWWAQIIRPDDPDPKEN